MTNVPRSYLVRFAQLAALWAFSVSQPVFSFLEGNREFLVLLDSGLVEIILFALLLTFAVPLAALAYVRIAALVSQWVSCMLYLATLAAFLVPLAFQLVKSLEPGRVQALLMVLALCGIAIACYVRWRAVSAFLTFSAILSVVSLVWFILGIPTTTDEARAASIKVVSPTPVVVVVLDELPTSSLLTRVGEIDAARYPGFAQLAREATWYPNATTVHERTARAVPAILTGRMPREAAVPTVKDYPENLFTLLGGSYSFSVQETLTRLCPVNLCARPSSSLVGRIDQLIGDVRAPYVLKVLPRSITNAERGAIAVDRRFERSADGAIGEFERFHGDLGRGETSRSLFFLHLMLPHHPWRFLPTGRRYATSAREVWVDGRETLLMNPWLAQQALQRHLVQLRYTDALVGRLLRRLQEVGLYDRALLVLVADHGASFRPGHPLRDVENANFAGIASVPLFVKYPGQERGAVDRRAARTIDILPTVADVLDVRLPWSVDGASLRRPAPDRSDAVVNGAGEFVRVPLRALKRQSDALTRRNAAWFGEGGDSLFRIGAHRDLLGTEVEEGLSTSRIVHVDVEDDAALLNVRKASGFVPALIQGVVDDGRVSAGTELAIAVNGRVWALTRVFLDRNKQRFHALVPESALADGSNRVDVFAIEGREGALRLVRLGGAG